MFASDSVFDRMGWKPEQFRSLRCEMPYPIYGSQICLSQRARRRDPRQSTT